MSTFMKIEKCFGASIPKLKQMNCYVVFLDLGLLKKF